jgi:phosphoribosylformimino-5-aminoimidazole carboxamide ribotide isomerase
LDGSIFNVIPVIDLLDGEVVHAKKGERSTYQPIQSRLTHSTKPLDIVAALLEVYPFRQLYIADLNAIQKLGMPHTSNYNVIAIIQRNYPNLQLWVDAGISTPEDLRIWNMPNVNLVLGTENFKNLEEYLLIRQLLQNNFILSLDYFSSGFLGPSELLKKNEYWPKDVIVMSLANVGSNQGANIVLLSEMKLKAPQTNVYAAGGIRNQEDLQTIKAIGLQGALLATSLHNLQINTQQLKY